MAREPRLIPLPDGERAIYEAGFVVNHLPLDSPGAIRSAIPLARSAALAVKSPSASNLRNSGDFTGMPIALFQNWLYEQNRDWHFSDGTLTALWVVEFPQAIEYEKRLNYVASTRREYNAGRHQSPPPHIPSVAYPPKQSEPRHAILKLRWTTADANGFVDWIPMARLGAGDAGEIIEHEVRGHGIRMRARCRVVVANRFTDLDYADPQCRQFNSEQGVDAGVLRLYFQDDARTILDVRGALPAVDWKQDSQSFQQADVQVAVSMEAVSWNKPEEREIPHRTLRSVLARPGQSVFRGNLTIAYGATCCVSGCGVSVALEGAHIEPYAGPHSDDPANGLLLRCDLHTLFDALLMTIEPDSRQVRIAVCVRSARGGDDYAKLLGRPLAEPTLTSGHRGPGEAFLRSHWARANAKHGKPAFF